MDAREYLARKGLDKGGDRERPNTLEEKAWARAREAGEHRPHAGTPYDWEDWERYHETLAEGADRLTQKINHEAHQRAATASGQTGVSQFTPVDGKTTGLATREAGTGADAAAEPRAVLLALAVLMPPLAMLLAREGRHRVAASVLLTLLGWLPGVVHAVWRLRRR